MKTVVDQSGWLVGCNQSRIAAATPTAQSEDPGKGARFTLNILLRRVCHDGDLADPAPPNPAAPQARSACPPA